jgi:ketosteroid isomerase-like protein
VLNLADDSGVSLLRTVTCLPRIPTGLAAEGLAELLAEEAALIDFVKSFAHTVNSADVDAVVGNYADDSTWISPRGRFVGAEAIRHNYGLYFDPVRWFSFWTNITVRFVRPFDEAYVSAYQYSIGVSDAGRDRLGAVSTDVWRVKRAGDAWKIAERRVDVLDGYNHRVLLPQPA